MDEGDAQASGHTEGDVDARQDRKASECKVLGSLGLLKRGRNNKRKKERRKKKSSVREEFDHCPQIFAGL